MDTRQCPEWTSLLFQLRRIFHQIIIKSHQVRTISLLILFQVASKWHTDVALFLLDHGADPNRTDFLGRSPLHVAAADDYPDMVKLLIENGGTLI